MSEMHTPTAAQSGPAAFGPVVAEATTLGAGLSRERLPPAGADAELTGREIGAAEVWRTPAVLMLGVLHLLGGRPLDADEAFAAAAETAAGALTTSVAFAERSLAAAGRRDWDEAAAFAQCARVLVRVCQLDASPASALTSVAGARVAAERGESQDARRRLANATSLSAPSTQLPPWFAVQVGLEHARVSVALADYEEARAVLAELEEQLWRRSGLGAFAANAHDLREELDTIDGSSARWASTLTPAELRLLPFLSTHLSLRAIAERFFVSRNTVKTQAASTYRKLEASSRAEAVDHAKQLGLIALPGLPPLRTQALDRHAAA